VKQYGSALSIKLEDNMLEAIIDRRNMEKALVQVIQNKGSAGVDGMQTDALRDYLTTSYQ
jgi:RNA-directed DNA polymerase